MDASCYNSQQYYSCSSLIRTGPDPLFEATIYLQQPDLYSRNQQMPLVSAECHTLKFRSLFQLYNCKGGQAMPSISQNFPQNNPGPTLHYSLASNLDFQESFCSPYLKYLISKVLYIWFLKSRDLSEGHQTASRNNTSSEACNQELLMNITPE